MSRFALLACVAASALFISPAFAQQATSNLSDQYWTVTVKGNVGMSPSYLGSGDLSAYGLPGLSFRKAGTSTSFSAPDDGLDFAILDMDWIKAGPVARYLAPRSHNDYSELTGLQTVNWGVEAGAFVDLWATKNFRTHVELMRSFHDQQGVVANIGEDWVTHTGAWTLAIGPRLALSNDHFTSTYFSVTPSESLASHGYLPAYHAQGGLTSYGVAGSATYDWSKAWSTTAYAGYNRLTQDAGHSPISSIAGSKNQFTVGGILAYSFDMKQFW